MSATGNVEQQPESVPEAPRKRRAPSAPRRVWFVALGVGAIATVAATLLAPHGSTPEVNFEGDEALVGDLESALDPDHVQGTAVARFPVADPDSVEWAFAGDDGEGGPITADTLFESGSVQKTFTAMTLADMVENGETSLDRTLEEVFPEVDFADPEVAGATLEDLATHHSGLPTAPAGSFLSAYLLPSFTMSGPYESAPDPLTALETTPAGEPGEFAYSNLGYSVLGEALAEESGTSYEELVRERVLDPLGMDDTVTSDNGTPEGGVVPHVEPGAPVQAWQNTAYAPAGVSTWTTVGDLVRFTTAVADGTAPGITALEPVHTEVSPPVDEDETPDGPGHDQGLAWMSHEIPDHGRVTEHSGATFGTHAMVVLDDDRVVVMLANATTANAPGVSYELLTEDPERPAPLLGEAMDAIMIATTVLMVAVPPLLLIALMARRRTLITQRPLDRLRVVSLSLGAVAWMIAAQRIGLWADLPILLWGVAVGLTAAGITVGAWHFRRVPVEAGRWRWLHVPVFVVSVLFSLVLGGTTLWGLLIAQ